MLNFTTGHYLLLRSKVYRNYRVFPECERLDIIYVDDVAHVEIVGDHFGDSYQIRGS